MSTTERKEPATRDDDERLAAAIADELARRGDGSRLLDLMRAEQNLLDALRVIRREIAVITRAAQVAPPPDEGEGNDG